MVDRGFFVVADITGYTEFLTRSGLEEAGSVLDYIYSGFIQAFQPPIQISNFQGDAILAYAPQGKVTHGQVFFQMIQGIYNAFVGLILQMERSAACTCNACDTLPKLDLKLFVHYGDFVVQNLGGGRELTGADVIIVHRMMKNSVREETGLKSYGLFSEIALRAMNVDPVREKMTGHTETYEHFGSVRMYVCDLRDRYNTWNASRRIFVKPDEASVYLQKQLSIAPSEVWHYLTQPLKMKEWMSFDSLSNTGEDSDIKRGTTFHCVRKTDNVLFTITDLRPFEYLTLESVGVSGVPYEVTYTLLKTTDGTTIRVFSRALDPKANEEDTLALQVDLSTNLDHLEGLVRHDLAVD